MKVENIKFKAKSIYNNEWVYGDLLQQVHGTYILTGKGENQFDFCPRVYPSTVCQFTGLKDKNGTPIYEGDIVIYKDSNAERRGAITWDSKTTTFYFGRDFLFHYFSEYMVIIDNKFNK